MNIYVGRKRDEFQYGCQIRLTGNVCLYVCTALYPDRYIETVNFSIWRQNLYSLLLLTFMLIIYFILFQQETVGNRDIREVRLTIKAICS